MGYQAVIKRVIFFAILLSANVCAEPVITETQSLYSIYGSTAQELRAQMRKLGPTVHYTPFDAYTHYYVKWNYQLAEVPEGCRLEDIRVSVKTTYTLPSWKNYTDGSSALKRNWNMYFSRLKAHEDGHAMHGRRAANEIDAMLRKLPAMSNCQVLEQAANDKAYEILGRYQNADVQYDAETNHGKDQGVVLQDE